MSGEELITPLSESSMKTFEIIGRKFGITPLFTTYQRGVIQTAKAAEEEKQIAELIQKLSLK